MDQSAVEETSNVTGGKLDHLIGNAAVMGDFHYQSLSELYVTKPTRHCGRLTRNPIEVKTPKG